MSRSRKAVLVACAATLGIVPNAWATHGHDPKPSPRSSDARAFVRDVPVSRIVHHQAALQRIARRNGDTREVLSNGYTESLNYVVKTLRRAGYKPNVTDFNFPFWEESAPAVLNRVSPAPTKVYRYGTAADNDSPNVDFITLGYAGTGTLTNAKVVPTNDIIDPPPAVAGASNSGCEAGDYPAETAGNVALVQRGTCSFVQKAAVAQQVGAAGVIIFNDGVGPARQNPIYVLNQVDLHIPAVISSYAAGNELLQGVKSGQDVRVDFSTFGHLADRFLPQVIADTKGGDKNNVLVVGAHLDSRPEGPGHQRRRQRHRDAARAGRGDRQEQARQEPAPEDPVRLVGRRGERPDRLQLLRLPPQRCRGGEDRRHARLRHARVAELRAVPV